MIRMFSTSEEKNKKNYVIDTSTLVTYKEAIHSFDNHNLYIPIEVLEEIDSLKVKKDELGATCRYINRFLDGVRAKGNLFNGVKLENGQLIQVMLSSDVSELKEGIKDSVDNRIISVAKKILKAKGKATIVSEDIALRVKGDVFGIEAISYESRITKNPDDDSEYAGMRIIEVEKEVVEDFYQSNRMYFDDQTFHWNEGVILKSGQSSALAVSADEHSIRPLRFAKGKSFGIQGISPRSKEQFLALELLLDPNVHMVSLTGPAGTGKTLLTVAAALQHLDKRNYEKVIISRPVQSTSKDIGFLPGTKEEKMAPWIQPIFDNFNVLTAGKGKTYLEMMMQKGIIEVEALTYIRGRTLPNTIFIIDEAQNITHHEAKAILTRMGENSKIILIGDLEQIDSPRVNEETSGLSSVVNLFKDFEHSGHVKLTKGERSKLATFAAQNM